MYILLFINVHMQPNPLMVDWVTDDIGNDAYRLWITALLIRLF
ncbi:Uncharacterised protein [Salmonella enterica subsp. enterica serovar Typhi]|nr:Uncharacterised protein [Salmonella enterica subsp. enterica serovar Typhi]CIM71109.1 Uncharacterised protein [Salmonella enterica subsp. enterica serovar Typhi]CIN38351.1 Uncharacterised protein [Salmonella enterica subsp. enterica serovar Typhi]CIN38395.1 Uncharacterised protein [Salmonella enterica subsp. enterica serovar Typhi]